MPSELSFLNKLIKNAHKENDPLTPLIDQYFLTRHKSKNRYSKHEFDGEERPRPPGRFSPSSICNCQRAAVFKFTGTDSRATFNPEQEAIFDDGTWRHARLDWQFRDMEAVLGSDVFRVVSIEENVEYEPLHIKGHLDAVINIRGVLYVVDFKGTNSKGFEFICREGNPRPHHVLQILCYERMRKVKRGFLFYENKDDNRNKIFPVDWTPQGWKQVQEWCKESIGRMDRQQLPPMDPDCKQGVYHFDKCPYAHLCFGNKTSAEVERAVYRTFNGVQELWDTYKDV